MTFFLSFFFPRLHLKYFKPDQRENGPVFSNLRKLVSQPSVFMPRAHPHFATSLIFLKWTSLSWMLPQGLLNSKQKYPWLSRVSTGYLENVIYINVPMVYFLCPAFQLQRTVHSRLLDMVVQSLCYTETTGWQSKTSSCTLAQLMCSLLELWLFCTKLIDINLRWVS